MGQNPNDIPKPQIEAISTSYKIVSNDPQIVEYNCTSGVVLYIRYNKDVLVCRNKKTNQILCSSIPVEYKSKIFIPKEQIEFYIEMYSNHKIKFI